MQYETTVKLPYGELGSMVRWCQTHCEKDWNFSILDQAGQESGQYEFQFESEKDYFTFLVWKK